MKLLDIAIKTRSKGDMIRKKQISITPQAGLENDFRGRPGNRQVTVLSMQQWQEACHALQTELPWTTRRANLLIDGIRFTETMPGQEIVIGDVRLRMTGETDPCSVMDRQYQGLKDALMPDCRGGVTCRVITPGTVTVGDDVKIVSQD